MAKFLGVKTGMGVLSLGWVQCGQAAQALAKLNLHVWIILGSLHGHFPSECTVLFHLTLCVYCTLVHGYVYTYVQA